MEECFLPTNVALGLKRGSPVRDTFNRKLRGLKEAGIVYII